MGSTVPNRLEGKLALVTGASRGIGRGIAERFAVEGARIAIGARTDREAAEETLRRVRAAGSDGLVVLGDVALEEDAARIVSEAAHGLGGLDIVVNNAGIDIDTEPQPAADWPVEWWDRIVAVNLRGPFLVSKFAIPHLLERGGGAILSIGSVAGLLAWEGDCAYNAAKAGLHVLMRTIAVDYAEQGIRANCICPGVIETEMTAAYIAGSPEAKAATEKLIAKHPVRRFGRVEEVAAMAVALCSDEASFVTGALVPVDGGYTAV